MTKWTLENSGGDDVCGGENEEEQQTFESGGIQHILPVLLNSDIANLFAFCYLSDTEKS